MLSRNPLLGTVFGKFSSVAQLCLTLCNPMDCCTPGFPVLHYLPEFSQTHVHWVDDVLQPSHALWPPSPAALNPLQHQGLSQWIGSLHQVARYWSFSLSISPFNHHYPNTIIRCLPKLDRLCSSLLFSNSKWEVYCLYFTEEENNAKSQ